MRINKNMIIIILCLLIIFLTIIIITTKIQNEKKLKQSKDKEIVECDSLDDEKFNLEKNENIVLFGDSITQFYPVDDIYDNYQIIGSGVSGYTTVDLLDRMVEMLYQYNPTKVFLLIGTNDIMLDTSEEKLEDTVDNIKKISEDIKKYRPNAKLYIESIYPVNKSLNKEMVNQRTNEAIKSMNKKIEEYCKKEKISYINIYDELTDKDGNFDKKYTNDGLHPNDLGYAKITKLLLPYIYE